MSNNGMITRVEDLRAIKMAMGNYMHPIVHRLR